jgi:plasmid maintenance system antidote protein VapI
MGKAKKAKPATLTDQLKAAIERSGLSIYAISKGSGVAQPVLSRFMAGERDIRMATADKLAAFFGLRLA